MKTIEILKQMVPGKDGLRGDYFSITVMTLLMLLLHLSSLGPRVSLHLSLSLCLCLFLSPSLGFFPMPPHLHINARPQSAAHGSPNHSAEEYIGSGQLMFYNT